MKLDLRKIERAALVALLTGSACGAVDPGGEETADTEDPAYISTADRWPSANIPVCWEGGGWSQEKQWVRAYIEKTYETLADVNIDFTSWAQCGASNGNGIRIQVADDVPRTTGLGTDIQGSSNGLRLNFAFANWSSSCSGPRNNRNFCIGAIAAHEFAHALGMAHEQNRPDTPGSCNQQQGSNGDTLVGGWDVESITNYCGNTWNNDGILSPGDIAGLTSMYMPSPGRGKSLFYRDNASNIREVYGSPAGWVANNLSTQTGAAVAVGPPDSIFHNGAQRVFYRGSNGSIHQLYHTPSLGWSYFALTANITGEVAAAGNPKAVGIQTYTHVFYRGTDNHIHQLFSNGVAWSAYDLSAFAGAADAAGDPAVYTMANSVHIIYRGTDNNLHTLEWEIDRGWRYINLTSSFGGRQATGNPAAMAIGFFQFVYYRGTDDHIHELWNNYMTGDSWTANDLFGFVTGEVNAASDPVVHNRSEYKNVFYRGTDNHMHELFFDPQPGWMHNDLTAITGGPTVTGQPSSVVVGLAQHVFYQGSLTNVIQELFHTPSGGWQKFNLGATIGTPSPIGKMAVHMH